MRRIGFIAWMAAALAWNGAAWGADYNIKVATDASPDYSDMPGMIRSITNAWPDTKDKCWAMYYWNHLARRQTNPMLLHGLELTDPIRQFNDYGFTQCSTIAGINCGIWANMGLPVKFWDVTLHTVAEVEYDGRWHMYDNSLSALYTLCDGETLAGVEDIGRTLACPASGGKAEPGHIAKYHCLYATSANGFLSGADTPRSLDDEGEKVFNPKGLKYRPYCNNWDWGHRYILNLRDGEEYTRYYHRLDAGGVTDANGGKKGFVNDPAYYVPNSKRGGEGRDPEAANPRYRIRGNGVWTFRPVLTGGEYKKYVHEARDVTAGAEGLRPERVGEAGVAVFRVESANVTASQRIRGRVYRRNEQDEVKLSVSVNNGLRWTEVWKAAGTGEIPLDLALVKEVNGAYEPMLKVELLGRGNAADAALRSLEIETVTQLNAKTQPKLRLGKNRIHVGTGEAAESIVLWPDLRASEYKKEIVEEHNIRSRADHPGFAGALQPAASNEDAWVVYRLDAPREISRLTYGGRFYNRLADGTRGYVRLLHSSDGRNWTQSWSLDQNAQPWDVIHYESVELAKGAKTAWVKVVMRTPDVNATGAGCSVYSLRMEANFAPADAAFTPLDVTFAWREVQKDYQTVERSHTQRIERTPCEYVISVGGEDHPVMERLSVRALGGGAYGHTKSRLGYSDGKDVGGENWVGRWMTAGRNLAEGKKYTVTIPSKTNWGAGDPDGTKLTDGVVGANYAGGATVKYAALWVKGDKPEITVDLERAESCAAFRIHLGAGWPWWDALKGEVKDTVEVLTSLDGKTFESQGFFDFNLRRRDIPVNYMLNDDETAQAFNFAMASERPVKARYVRFRLAAARAVTVSEVQVLDSLRSEPFDLKITLPGK